MRFHLGQNQEISCPFTPRGTRHAARDGRPMHCSWFSHGNGLATSVFVLETVPSTVRIMFVVFKFILRLLKSVFVVVDEVVVS